MCIDWLLLDGERLLSLSLIFLSVKARNSKMKKEQVKHLKNSSSKLHLRYIRLPDRVSEYYDELVFRSEKVMVGRSRITPTHPVAVEGEVVMGHGFEMTYF